MKTTIRKRSLLSMKQVTALLFVGLLSGLFSCTDLTEKMYSDIPADGYQYTPENAAALIGSAYVALRGSTGNIYYCQEITTDETVQPANSTGWSDGGRYLRMHLHTWNSDQDHLSSMWDFLYAGVFQTNIAIDNLTPMANVSSIKPIVLEARALRAYYFWLILDNFGDAPMPVGVSKDLPKMTKRADIYNFVVAELKEAIAGLPSKSSENYGHINKEGAETLLANVYLNAEVYTGTPQWAECKNMCDSVINSGNYTLDADYRTPFSATNEVSKENIFVIPFDATYAHGFNYYHVSLHSENAKTYNTGSPWGSGSYKGVPQFIDTYNPNDVRIKDTWVYGQQYSSKGDSLHAVYDKAPAPLNFVNKMPDGEYTAEDEGYRWLKYEIPLGSSYYLNNDFVIFRYAQVLMMKAECLLRTGDAAGAAVLVSQVRQRAFPNNPALATVTGADLLLPSSYKYGVVKNYVLTPENQTLPAMYGRFYDELGWEFVGEACRRRDMIRFGTFTKAQWLSHTPQGDYRTVFPIPRLALSANPNLVQNPNYN